MTDFEVMSEDSPIAEENGPIVIAGSDKRQLLRAGIGHVCADVKKIFEKPKGTKSGTCRFAFEKEEDEAGERSAHARA